MAMSRILPGPEVPAQAVASAQASDSRGGSHVCGGLDLVGLLYVLVSRAIGCKMSITYSK